MRDNPTLMAPGRRKVLKAAGIAAAVLAAGGFPKPAITQTLRKVTLVYGVQTVDSSTGFFSSIPMAMGFYKEEGIEMEIQAVAGSSAALNLLASGQAQISSHGTAGLFSGVGRGVAMQGFICQIPEYFVSVGVLEEGPIRSFEDLKGKTIGINAQGGSPHLVLTAVFNRLGWKEGTDYQYQAVGTAQPALDALRRNRVQALALWDTIFAAFEFYGTRFRYFRPDPIPEIGFTHSSNAMIETINRQPELIRGLTRAMNKATVFMAAAQPEELTKLHYKVFPETEPTGMSREDGLRLDRMRMAAREPNMRFKQRVWDRTERLGDATDAQIAGHRDLLVTGRVIPEALPVERYFTRQFLDFGNDFNINAVIAQAKAFRA